MSAEQEVLPWEDQPVAEVVIQTESKPLVIRLSPSKMILWKECRRHAQAKILKEVEDSGNIYSAVGSAVHTVIEKINRRSRLSPTALAGLDPFGPEERAKALKAELVKEVVKSGIDMDFPPSFKESREMIKGYEVPAGWTFLEGEQKRLLEFHDEDGKLLWQFSYLLDAMFGIDERGAGRVSKEVVLNDGDLVVNDYKSSSQPPKTGIQLQLYAWAEALRFERDHPGEAFDRDAIKACFWMTRTDKKVWVPVSSRIIQEVDDWMHASVALMRAYFEAGKDFETTPGNCRFCPRYDCPDRK